MIKHNRTAVVLYNNPEDGILHILNSRSYLTIDGLSASLFWYQSTIWEPRMIFLFRPWNLSSDSCDSVYFIMGCPSEEKSGLSFPQSEIIEVSR
jgi:hypothetical protein